MRRLTLRLTLSAAALAAGASMATAQSACGQYYEIRPGDTLYSVSQQCRVGLNRIMRLNPNVDARDMQVGQEIRLTARQGDRNRDRDRDYSDRDRYGRTGDGYRVGEGDTLYSIAQAVGVSILELLNANEELDPTDLAVGDLIRLPSDEPSAAIRISPDSGPPGSTVRVRARNLRPNDWVTIGVGRAASEWRAIDQARVEGDGDLRTRVTVPDWADPGSDLIYVVDTDRGVTLKSRRFDVVGRGQDDDGTGNGRDRITLEGRVSFGTECAILTTSDGDEWSLTSNDVRFTEGEYVRVRGQRADASYCQQGVGTVDVARLREIEENGGGRDGRDDRDRDEGRDDDRITLQGRVREGVECMVLETDDGDTWSLTSDDVRFTPGEYVRVRGQRAEMSYCQQGVGTVDVARISEVDDGRNDRGDRDRGDRNDGRDDGDRITLEGRVGRGAECMTLRTDDGDIWSLTSDDIGFTEGEYVRVRGQRAEASFCQQGVGTVEVRSLREVSPG